MCAVIHENRRLMSLTGPPERAARAIYLSDHASGDWEYVKKHDKWLALGYMERGEAAAKALVVL